MTTRVVTNETERLAFYELLTVRKMPFTVTVESGRKRSTEQNSLSHKWYQEIADQRGDVTRDYVRAESKLMFGVPILREENAEFKETYDRCLKNLPFEAKVEFIQRTELPITSLMTTKQLSRYLDDIQAFWLPKGVILTIPDTPPSLVDGGRTGGTDEASPKAESVPS